MPFSPRKQFRAHLTRIYGWYTVGFLIFLAGLAGLEQLGMSRGEAEGQLAQALPDVVNGMTPQGQIPEGHNDLVNEALAILRQRQGG